MSRQCCSAGYPLLGSDVTFEPFVRGTLWLMQMHSHFFACRPLSICRCFLKGQANWVMPNCCLASPNFFKVLALRLNLLMIFMHSIVTYSKVQIFISWDWSKWTPIFPCSSSPELTSEIKAENVHAVNIALQKLSIPTLLDHLID